MARPRNVGKARFLALRIQARSGGLGEASCELAVRSGIPERRIPWSRISPARKRTPGLTHTMSIFMKIGITLSDGTQTTNHSSIPKKAGKDHLDLVRADPQVAAEENEP